jgi:hypothetical protein
VVVLGSDKADRAHSRFDSLHELAHLVVCRQPRALHSWDLVASGVLADATGRASLLSVAMAHLLDSCQTRPASGCFSYDLRRWETGEGPGRAMETPERLMSTAVEN